MWNMFRALGLYNLYNFVVIWYVHHSYVLCAVMYFVVIWYVHSYVPCALMYFVVIWYVPLILFSTYSQIFIKRTPLGNC